ncbi:V-type proton ATPase subunit S1-like [Diadema setosum]|uniref:V-type proton ATPase subunit S1-like n=1 Tax=Diadema setosum TaxID=31175 RepID=UPI003B3BDDA5
MGKASVFMLLIAISFFSVSNATSVPVIAWSSTRDLFSTRQISAGEEISQASLRQDFLDKGLREDVKVIVLILLDKLSLGDLTRYGNAYDSSNQGGVIPNIKSSMESATSSLVLPQTDTSSLVDDLISKVKGQNGEVTELTDPEELSSVAISPSRTNLVIVRVAPSNSMEEQLQTADGLVKSAMHRLRANSDDVPYTIIFSADDMSKQSSHASGRRLLEATETADNQNFTFINFTQDGCMAYLFADSISVELMVNGAVNRSLVLPNDRWNFEGVCENNFTYQLTFSVSDLRNENGSEWITSVSISMNFNKTTNNYWFVDSTTIVYQLKDLVGTNNESISLPDDLMTPIGWSYHCGNTTFAQDNQTDVNYFLNVMLNNFQLQPIGITNNKFSSANDCIGYFTPGIWMGILTTLMVVLIVGFAVTMMASVKVMDKFDDPKGKPLVINVAE